MFLIALLPSPCSAARERYVACKAARRDTLRKLALQQALMLSPITPHFSEHVCELLGEEGKALLWPGELFIDAAVLFEADYLQAQKTNFRKALDRYMAPQRKKEKTLWPTKAVIAVTPTYLDWQARVFEIVRPLFDPVTKTFPTDAIELLRTNKELKAMVSDKSSHRSKKRGCRLRKMKTKTKKPRALF